MKTLHGIRTPAAIVDLPILQRNLDCVSTKMTQAGVKLRPHLKTAKSIDIATMATENHFGGITVSTLREAEYFFENGIKDITYAVCISPDKLDDVLSIQREGTRLNIITDHLDVAKAIAAKATSPSQSLSVFIELDVGYTRSGVLPESDALLQIAQTLDAAPHVTLKGVLTHAGHSYDEPNIAGLKEVAEIERTRSIQAAERIRALRIECPEVSIGSTPTVVHGESFEGITEVRPGNYVFFDLSMCSRNVCQPEDIALTVLTTVIVNQPDRSRVLTDAGGIALSKDLGIATSGNGFGLVHDIANKDTGDRCIVDRLCQEQGWLGAADSGPFDTDAYPVGRRLRILPNHSCITAAAYDKYYVVDGDIDIVAEWNRCNGW